MRVLDVATGTAAVAIELARAMPSRSVVGVDQSPEMLAAGRVRVETAGLGGRIELREGNAESLPFVDGQFDALTFTYLLRYVDEPLATLRELARVVRPGGTIAMLEFGLPRGVWRPLWELYVRVGLPAAGALISPGWREVGRFLGPNIREFHGRISLTELWREAGLGDVIERRLSLGGGVVVWATK
jgi:demethylmenaquinone methyltransferase / 2-methoxy-6-polyprenyl-1,4-benzoquinol methylase